LFLEGGFAVELKPGSPSTPELDSGSTIPIAQTATPVQFHQILSAFNRPTRESFQSLVDQLDAGLSHGGATALSKTWKPLSPVLAESAQIAEASRGVRPHDASDVVQSSARITGALASREGDLSGMVTALHRTTAAIASRDAELSASLRELDGLLADTPPALDAVDSVVAPVDRFTAAVRPALRAAPPVLSRAVGVLDQLEGAVGKRELPALLAGLGPSIRRLPALERRLGGLLELATPVTDCVREKALPVLLAKAPDDALSSGRPIWQDLAHSMVGLADASQNADGNGYAIRFLGGVGEQAFSTGDVPNVGTLTGLVDQKIIGARPVWLGPGVAVPYRPDQPCTAQATVDLSQRTAPVTPGRTRAVDTRPAPLGSAAARLLGRYR
jgi:hypothetical protein